LPGDEGSEEVAARAAAIELMEAMQVGTWDTFGALVMLLGW
jgi:hypothetical protein